MDGIFKLDESNKTKIKSAISQQLATILGQEEDEDVLPEYVMVMIANQKTKEQVKGDLEAFLGDQSAAFTTWLWSMLSSFTNTANATSVKKEPQAVTSVVTKPKQEEKLRTSSGSDTDRHKGGREQKYDNNNNNRDHRQEEAPVKSVFASVITVPPQPKRHDVENPAPSRLVLNAVSEAVKSVPPPPQRSPQISERMDEDMRDRKHRAGRRTGGSVFGRLGYSNDRGHDRKSDGRGDRMSDGRGDRMSDGRMSEGRGDRMSDRNERVSAVKEEPVTFTITLNGAEDVARTGKRRSMETAENGAKASGDTEMTEEESPEGDESNKKLKKQKCQFWPNCKRGESCIFVHPTTQCNLFPNCTYGDNCLYIHPAIPCKFGAACARAGCVYNHPAGAGATAQQKGIPCKHGFACSRDGCTFVHPPEACRYGEGCTRPNCHFGHGKACRFGVTCATPGCSFAHYKDAQNHKDVQIACKFGANCTNIGCKFQHNKTTPAEGDQDMMEAAISELSATLPPTPPREEVVV